MAVTKCPDCGSNEIGKGKFSGYASLNPVGKIFSAGSAVIVDVCTNCGTIICMKSEKPEKFKTR
jgi:predicted  nucleic acid-binding Zn-ribbon protein